METNIYQHMETMYLEPSDEEQQQADEYEDTDAASFSEQLQNLQAKVDTLEKRLKEVVDSTLNREEALRAAIEAMAQEAK